MERYTIYCTKEQTKKAFALGAPLEFISMFRYGDDSLPKFVHKDIWNIDEFCYCPTAEQMMCWLEEQEDIDVIKINKAYKWTYSIYNKEYNLISMPNECHDSRKYATLAAIDAALDYLTKIRQS